MFREVLYAIFQDYLLEEAASLLLEMQVADQGDVIGAERDRRDHVA